MHLPPSIVLKIFYHDSTVFSFHIIILDLTYKVFQILPPKSRIMPIYCQDFKSDNSAELIRENKNLLPSVTSQESQRIGRLPLRYKWDELPITLQQDILKALYQYKN